MKNRIILLTLTLFFISISLRLIFILMSDNTQLGIYDDDGTYHQIVSHLRNGEGYYLINWDGKKWYSFRPPVLVIFLYIIYGIFGWQNYLAAKIGLAVVGSILPIVIYWLTIILFKENNGQDDFYPVKIKRIALLAALITAIFPAFIHYSIHLQSEMLFLLFLTTSITLLYLSKTEKTETNIQKPEIKNHNSLYVPRYSLPVVQYLLLTTRSSLLLLVLAGICFGLACLTRSMIFGFIPFIYIWMLINNFYVKYYTSKIQGKKSNSFALLITRYWLPETLRFSTFLFGIILIMLPWWLRNYRIHHNFIPLTTEGGFTFYVGNNPLSTGGGECIFPPLTKVPTDYKEKFMDRLFYQEAKEYIFKNPTRFWNLTRIKVTNFWRIYPKVGSKLTKFGSAIVYILLFILTLVGISLTRSRWRDFTILVFLVFYFTLIHSIFPSLMRYRLPLEPSFIMFSCYTVVHFFSQRKLWKPRQKLP